MLQEQLKESIMRQRRERERGRERFASFFDEEDLSDVSIYNVGRKMPPHSRQNSTECVRALNLSARSLSLDMSVRRYSFYNPMPWTIWGVPIAFGGFGIGYREKCRFWGFNQKPSWLHLRLRGMASAGVLSLLGLFARFLHLPAFLLFVPYMRVLTIAHMTTWSRLCGVAYSQQHAWLILV